MVVISAPCLALVGQPTPQYPRFQQPLTLRGIICQLKPSFSHPCRKMPVLRLGAVSLGAMEWRGSPPSDQGAMASGLTPSRPKRLLPELVVSAVVPKPLVE